MRSMSSEFCQLFLIESSRIDSVLEISCGVYKER